MCTKAINTITFVSFWPCVCVCVVCEKSVHAFRNTETKEGRKGGRFFSISWLLVSVVFTHNKTQKLRERETTTLDDCFVKSCDFYCIFLGFLKWDVKIETTTKAKMMQHKRSLASVNQSSFVNLMPKRLKIDAPLSSKEKKERVSERVSALQQLVSPYGKTDTASVLLDSMEYISFLHEQVKVLSAPYLCSTEGEEVGGLRAKGLCVVPTCFVLEVGSSNGADIWAPIKTSPPSARRLVSDEGASVVTYS